MTSSPIRRLLGARSAGDLFIAQAAPALSALFLTFGTAALLGPAGRGQLATMMTTANLAGLALSWSLFVGAVRATDSGIDGVSSARRLNAKFVGGFAVLSVLACVIIAARGGGALEAALTCIATMAVAVNLVALRTAQGLGHSRAFRNAWVSQSVGLAAVALPVVYLVRDARVVVALWVVILILTAIPAARAVNKARSGPRDENLVLRLSTASHLSSMGYQGVFRLDVIVLALFVPAAEVGHYSIAAAATGVIWILAEVGALFVFARPTGETRTQRRSREIRVIKVVWAASLLALILVMATAQFFVPRWLPEYRESLSLMLILAPGVLAQVPARILFSALSRHGSVRALLVHGALCAAGALLYFPAAVVAGTPGVAAMSSVLYVAQAILVLILWRRMHTERLSGLTSEGL